MKTIVIIATIIFSLSNTSFAQTKDNTAINWITFEQLSDSLAINPKKVLIFFHTDWCVYCKKMLKETFKDKVIIDKINSEYYAVHFDAESIDSVTFDNSTLYNQTGQKKRGQYHQIAQLLLANQYVFPTTLVFDDKFSLLFKSNKYMSIKDFVKIL